MVAGRAEATKLGEEQKLQQKQLAQQRTIEARAQAAQLQQQRQRTPSEIPRGSPQDIQVRQQETISEQQRLVSENVQRIASSGGAFESARADALKSGKFDYGSVRSAYYSPPTEFINQKGERVTRPSISSGTDPYRTVTVTRAETLPKTGTSPRDLSNLAVTTKPKEQIGQREETVRPGTGEREIFPQGQLTEQQKEGLSKVLTREQVKEPIGSKLLKKASGYIIPNDYSVYSGKVDPLIVSDIVNLLPIGFGGVAAKEATSVGITTAEKLTTKGTADIGLAVRIPVKETRQEENILRDFNRAVEATGTKQPTRIQIAKGNRIVEAQILKERSIKTATVNLGRGPGKIISKGKKGSTITGTKPPSSGTSEQSFKEIQVGKGTKQLIRTKQETKTKPEQQLKQEQIQKQVGKQKQEPKPIEEKIQTIFGKQIIKEKPKEKEKPTAFIPIFGQPQTQKTGGGYPITTALLIPTPTPTKPPPTIPPPKIPTPPPPKIPTPSPKPQPEPTPKKSPLPLPELKKLISPSERGKALGSKRVFAGNVPESDIVGMFRGEEISYKTKTIKMRESYKTPRERKIRIL